MWIFIRCFPPRCVLNLWNRGQDTANFGPRYLPLIFALNLSGLFTAPAQDFDTIGKDLWGGFSSNLRLAINNSTPTFYVWSRIQLHFCHGNVCFEEETVISRVRVLFVWRWIASLKMPRDDLCFESSYKGDTRDFRGREVWVSFLKYPHVSTWPLVEL